IIRRSRMGILRQAPGPVGSREIWAWCLYDFANSSFSTLIVTVAYSVYFVQVVARPLGQNGTAERIWFWGYAISMLVAAVLSPVLGALADVRAAKRPFLIGSTLICVAGTFLASRARGPPAQERWRTSLATRIRQSRLYCSSVPPLPGPVRLLDRLPDLYGCHQHGHCGLRDLRKQSPRLFAG